eukprot:403374687
MGKIESVHFIDMNRNESSFKLPYTDMIKRCEETERRLIYLEKECQRYKVKLITPQNLEHLEQAIEAISENKRKAIQALFEDLENEIKEKEQFVITQNEKIKSMFDILNMQIEYKIVLDKADKIIHGKLKSRGPSLGSIQDMEGSYQNQPFAASGSRSNRNMSQEEIKEDDIHLQGRLSGGSIHSSFHQPNRLDQSYREVQIRYVAGTIETADVERFRRILFRSLRGKVLSYLDESDNIKLQDFSGQNIQKSVFVLVFEEGSHFVDKVQRICDSFQAKRYSLPEGGHTDHNAFKRKIQKIDKTISDTQQMLKMTRLQMHQYLEGINQAQNVAFSVQEVYKQFIRKEKQVYLVLNQLKTERNLCYGFMWSHLSKHKLLDMIYRTLGQGMFEIDMQQKIQVEDVTYSEIINTYGIPTYKEINPAIFACVTFPFLFGIMFGDIGHGSVLLLIGIILCLFNSYLDRIQSMRGVLMLRYLILLMGFFATFSGLVYNDFMSIPLNLFDSCYSSETGRMLKIGCQYPFGIDPIWYLSKNELSFQNSLKMKLSVILGVLQMSLGVFLKACNAKYFKNYMDLLHEFIPQILLLWVLFGYMDALIIIKWCTNYAGIEHEAPSIITTMINMALNGGKVDGKPFIGSHSTNQAISILFFLLALICVPWMLFVKPLKLKNQHKNNVGLFRNLTNFLQHYGSDHRQNSEEIELKDLNADRQKNYEIFVEEEVKFILCFNSFIQKDQEENYNNQYEGGYKNGHRNGNSAEKLVLNDQYSMSDYKNNEELVLKLVGQNGTDNHDFSEIFIHQLIETIEFVLGTISNTASYLRLWALSLAHSQLASVFFEHTLKQAIEAGNPLQIVASSMVWASATFGVLMCMDVLECFLHTLRLHWVEFQNKFYKGQGYKFAPFSYQSIFK